MRGELDLLVVPFGRAVHARDQAHTVHAAEIAERERVARLRLVLGAVGEGEMPARVFLPRVRLQVLVLCRRRRLHLVPLAAQDVAPRVDELLRVPDTGRIDGVRRHRPRVPIPAPPRTAGVAGITSGPNSRRDGRASWQSPQFLRSTTTLPSRRQSRVTCGASTAPSSKSFARRQVPKRSRCWPSTSCETARSR